MEIINYKNNLALNDSQMLRQYNVLCKWVAKFNEKEGPRVGDFVLFQDGSFKRLTHDWGDTIQTTVGEESGSFCIDGGACDFSGSLERGIDKSKLRFTHTYKKGRVWFFKDGLAQAHSGIDAYIPCKVWTYDEGKKENEK